MANWKKLVVGSLLVIMSSGCSLFSRQEIVPDIVMVGDCEHGLVDESNLPVIKAIFPLAQRTDVLIAGGCYQSHFIKAK